MTCITSFNDFCGIVHTRAPSKTVGPGQRKGPSPKGLVRGFGAAWKNIQHLYIQSLRAKLELCRIIAASLMNSIESQKLTTEERRAGFRCWVTIARDGDILELMLDLIRRREREERDALFLTSK